MKKVILCIVILLICTTGCSVNIDTTDNDKSNMMQNCFNLYYEFLIGEISSSVNGNEDSIIDIYDIFHVEENYNKYTFFDSNHNGVPELHLSSMRDYRILECIDDELVLIYSGSGYETLLNNGALLYTRRGGGPEHIDYIYKELDYDNSICQITFSKYNTNNDDEDDLYIFDDEEISKKEFDEKTNDYLNEKNRNDYMV